MIKQNTLFLLSLLISIFCFSQSSFTIPRSTSDKIRFKLIDNLIVLPVEVNGVELSFLLDSGVSKPILFNIANHADSLQINHVEIIYLRGLGGEGSIEALKSKHNLFRIGNAINVNQDVFVVFDNAINFTPRLGVPIHGIIGYDVFKDFIVEINYSKKFIKLHNPKTYVYKDCKKCETLNLTLNQNKPYIDASVEINSNIIPVKLLIDSGGSDALWLFEDENIGMAPVGDKYFEDYLGKGLSGSVYGKRSKVTSFSLNSFKLEEVNVAFPDSISISFARKFKERSGSISGELLKRFNIIMDYPNGKVTFKKNGNFKSPFHYNKSGIVLEQDGIRVVKESKDNVFFKGDKSSDTSNRIVVQTSYNYAVKPAFKIVELRKDSPAEKAGLHLGDVVVSINNKEAHDLSLQEINGIFRADDGKHIKMKVDRNGVILTFRFVLVNLF